MCGRGRRGGGIIRCLARRARGMTWQCKQKRGEECERKCISNSSSSRLALPSTPGPLGARLPPGLTVRPIDVRRCLFQHTKRLDQWRRHAFRLATDIEIHQRTLRLSTPVAVRWDLKRAKGVGLGAELAGRRVLSRRAGAKRGTHRAPKSVGEPDVAQSSPRLTMMTRVELMLRTATAAVEVEREDWNDPKKKKECVSDQPDKTPVTKGNRVVYLTLIA